MQNGIKVFPNPVTNNILQIITSRVYPPTLKLMLYETAGTVVKLQMIGANTSIIKADVSALNYGNYFLVLSDDKKITCKEKVTILQ